MGLVEFFGSAMKPRMIRVSRICAVFLTHLNPDHAGGVDTRCAGPYAGAAICLSEQEARRLDGAYVRKGLLGIGLRTSIQIHVPCVTLRDMQIVAVGNAIVQAILTPGHTLGHMSYLVNDRYLFVGDALAISDDGGYCFYDSWNFDSDLNTQFLRKLKRLGEKRKCELIITSHTGYTGNIDHAFRYLNELTKAFRAPRDVQETGRGAGGPRGRGQSAVGWAAGERRMRRCWR